MVELNYIFISYKEPDDFKKILTWMIKHEIICTMTKFIVKISKMNVKDKRFNIYDVLVTFLPLLFF